MSCHLTTPQGTGEVRQLVTDDFGLHWRAQAPNHAMEPTTSRLNSLSFRSLIPYPVAMRPLARGSSSWSR